MARLGITYQDIANAAEEISAQGNNPTIENIRAITGTGSNSTIAPHLKAWKNRQDRARLLCVKENLPEEIVLTMKGLWERVLSQADEKIETIKQDFEQTIVALKDKNTKLEEESIRWQRQHQATNQEKEGLAADKAALEHVVRKLENESIELTVKNDTATKQLQEKQEYIDELQRLNKQVQANLEHYYEASREQRVREQQRHEAAQNQLELTIKQLQQEAVKLNQQLNNAQNECEQLQKAKTTTQSQYDQLSIQNESIKSRLDQTLKDVIQHADSEHHWQNQYQKVQEKVDGQHTALANLQTELGVMTQKFSEAHEKLNELTDQNKYLANERWILNQENSQLVGQLKQFEKFGIDRVTA
tara:strand:+ start:33 stop:1109 length:1077 start_codon:yes stop_codon:yes gene_type:complete